MGDLNILRYVSAACIALKSFMNSREVIIVLWVIIQILDLIL